MLCGSSPHSLGQATPSISTFNSSNILLMLKLTNCANSARVMLFAQSAFTYKTQSASTYKAWSASTSNRRSIVIRHVQSYIHAFLNKEGGNMSHLQHETNFSLRRLNLTYIHVFWMSFVTLRATILLFGAYCVSRIACYSFEDNSFAC